MYTPFKNWIYLIIFMISGLLSINFYWSNTGEGDINTFKYIIQKCLIFTAVWKKLIFERKFSVFKIKGYKISWVWKKGHSSPPPYHGPGGKVWGWVNFPNRKPRKSRKLWFLVPVISWLENNKPSFSSRQFYAIYQLSALVQEWINSFKQLDSI